MVLAVMVRFAATFIMYSYIVYVLFIVYTILARFMQIKKYYCLRAENKKVSIKGSVRPALALDTIPRL